MRKPYNTLLYKNCLTPNDPFELVFHRVRERGVGLHDHDFAEILWMESGSCRHLWNGSEHVLRARDLVLFMPKDRHAFKTYRGEGFLCFNLAFMPRTLRDLARRYGLDKDPFWGAAPPVARLRRLSPERSAWLSRIFRELTHAPKTKLVVDHFLMDLMLGLGGAGTNPFSSCPEWLQDACAAAMADPEALREGVRSLSRLAGRSVEHISRIMRDRTGRAPVEWLTEWRLARASALLAESDMPIGELAVECGFSSLSHFYKIFTKRFKLSPRRHRIRQRFLLPETPMEAP